MVYFLALLGVALGAVSLLVYRTTRETLLAKRNDVRNRLEAEFKDRCDKERARLEYALLSQARTMAGLVEFQWADERQGRRFFRVRELYGRGYPQLSALWLLTTIQGPNAHLTTPAALALGTEKPLGIDPNRPNLMKMRFDEDELVDHVMPFDPNQFPSDQVIYWRHDILAPGPGRDVLRVVLKVSPNRRINRA